MSGYEQDNKRKNVKKRSKEQINLGKGILDDITPHSGYYFFSDYFKVDKSFATILTMFNKDGSDDNLPPFWGINLIPRGVSSNVTTRLLQGVQRAEQKWIDDSQSKADRIVSSETAEAERVNKNKDYVIAAKKRRDFQQIAMDLTSGDSYLHVSFKLLIKAPTLNELDVAVEQIKREYDVHFGGVYLATFEGQQKDDLTNLTGSAKEQLGKNYMFTSTELAGAYNIVTHGIDDPKGEYVGQMRADVNNAAVLWDINQFTNHVVIATNNRARTLSRKEFNHARSSSMWGVKIAQSALMNNHRVIHLVLNGAKLDMIGADLSDITTQISLNSGDINPFEIFGEVNDELVVFPAHTNKISLMAKQMNPEIDESGLGLLRDLLRDYYIDANMWAENAQENRDRLRIVGIPHHQVPRLRNFVPYIATAYKNYISNDAKDPTVIKNYSLLRTIFNDMLEENGDLFDTITSDVIDNAENSPQVIYNFSSLLRRGRGIAMAQFVNALGYATSSLKRGDLLVIHGVDQLDKDIEAYTLNSLESIYDKDVRVAFLYDSVEKMVEDTSLNNLANADWSLTGYMSNPTIERYEEVIGAAIPDALRNAIKIKEDTLYYLRRNRDNIVFEADLVLE